jgi:hypothetical protein
MGIIMKRGGITFKVSGVLPFPVDMLRYDACYPQTAEDTAEIEASINREKEFNRLPRRFVTLVCPSMVTAPTVGRWISFGWRVEQ